MNVPVAISTDSLPSLVDRAARALSDARSSAEVLDARDMARVAYDAAKSAARIVKAKQAHDTLIVEVHRAQAYALQIEATAKMRLADEYDAAQDRGEVRGRGNPILTGGEELPGPEAVGLTDKGIHEARKLRDAEQAEPGLIKRALDAMVQARQEPTRAELQRSVLAAVEDARHKPREDRRNPHHVPDAFRDRVLTFIDHCEQLAGMADEIGRIAAYADPRFPTTQTRMDENARAALAVLTRFMETRSA